jgi:cobalt-zinc-cadmium resistance protein CzcA
VGLGIPLFFSEQRAKLKAATYSRAAVQNMQEDYARAYLAQKEMLVTEMEKYRQSIDFYEQTGHMLAQELIRAAEISFGEGEIDFFRFAESIDRAVEIELKYMEDLRAYNRRVIELNHLTLL